MTDTLNSDNDIGVALANRLGLKISKREGHDLAGPCISCQSSDAFRLHQQTGVANCFSCGAKWSPFQVAEQVLGDREQAKSLLVELGVFQPARDSARKTSSTPPDPLTAIAKQKAIPRESLVVYGAKAISPHTIRLPAYGPDGKPCTTFCMSTNGGKGLFAKGKPAGLFFPHEGDAVRLPQSGETWHLVEGVKDAAALHDLGLLACGLNTCRLAAKFARLFAGVHVVLIPDRDRAGEQGAPDSAGVLHGFAKSVRVATLPAEFKESDGADVRDILHRPEGEKRVRQAIEDATPVEAGQQNAGCDSQGDVSAEIELPEGEPVTVTVSPAGKKPQRLVVAQRGDIFHRDRLDTDSSISRKRFVKELAAKIGVTAETLGPLVDPHLTELADQAKTPTTESSGSGGDNRESDATIAARMAAEWDLWRTPAGDAYATVPVDGHQETWPLRSRTFKRYVAKQFFDQQGKAIASESLSSAINLMEATALFEGEEHDIYVRVAGHEGNIYLDLCNRQWQVIEITPSGWQVIDESPVHFRRSRSMLALPMPEKGGTVDELRTFLNVDDVAWRLIVAWLLAAFRPRGPYPLLALFAEQGSGKSTAGRLLRSLIDPNSAPLRSEHRGVHDLMIGANNSWCLAYDNLSSIPSWLSDALCRLSTGGGFATRELYTDLDEIIFDSQRPVLLTSIEEVASRSDLLDRLLIVWLPAIPEDRRRREEEIESTFDIVRPRILGALLDAVSGAMRELANTRLAFPRMADFAAWVVAAETALGWPAGTFLAAFHRNLESANDLALESSAVARPLLELLEQNGEWNGPASDLLESLSKRVTDQTKQTKDWPKNGRSMAGRLKRLAPNLRKAGWEVDYDRSSSQRTWTIRPSAKTGLREVVQVDPKSVETIPKREAIGQESCFDGADDARVASRLTCDVVLEEDGNEWEEGTL